MTPPETAISWPASRLGEALAALGRRSRLGVRAVEVEAPPATILADGGERLGRWIESAAAWLGLEAEPVQAAYAEVDKLLTGAAPALLRVRENSETRFLVLLGSDRRGLTLLTPELAPVRRAPQVVRALLCREVEAPAKGLVDQILVEAGVRGRRSRRARPALLRELLLADRVDGCWLLRSAPGARLGTQVREAGLPRLLVALAGAHLCGYGLWLLSWWLLGWMTLQGRLEPGWLLAWMLLLMTLIPCRLLTTAAGGRLAIQAGALIKRRLLAGALQLEPDEIRHLGAGQLLGQVLESEAIESLALTGGFLGLTAVVELVLASLALGAGAGSWGHVSLLFGAASVTLWLGCRYYRHRQQWTAERLALTNDLVERMIGHRTRLAQEARAYWNDGEDQALEHYLEASHGLDRTGVALQVLVPRCWLLAGVLGLAPGFVTGSSSPVGLAVGVGGLVLAYRALRGLVESLDRLLGAFIAWRRIQLFRRAATRREPLGQPGLTALLSPAPSRDGRPLLDGRDLVFRYRDRPEAVLQGTGVRICAGDRVLLEGASGGGKSTLAALLAGCRVPTSGLLLLDGLDRETLGAEGWRRRVVVAPQFHENHVLMGTFAFNALMGRGWPPRRADLEEAERVCRALELGPLLDRMPAGMQQIVGETGWQLSHGEKSRLYLARALLQQAEVIILDESFAALDPQTLQRTLRFVLAKVATVLVIAHP